MQLVLHQPQGGTHEISTMVGKVFKGKPLYDIQLLPGLDIVVNADFDGNWNQEEAIENWNTACS